MLVTYRRHNPKRCRLRSRSQYNCRCPIWVVGTRANGERIREALKLRDWNRAQELVRRWDVEGTKPEQPKRTTLTEWEQAFLEDAKARHLSDSTTKLYRLLFRQLKEWADTKGIEYVNELDLNYLTVFRASWKNNPLSASKKLERLRGVFKFAVARKWMPENPALQLAKPKVKENPTLPFTKEEIKAILKDASTPERKRVRAFILTMRYSGLRISDVTKLRVDALKGNRLFLYQAKTGEPVSVLLPQFVVDALHAFSRSNLEYFFCSGRSKLNTATGFWRSRLSKVFRRAKIVGGHPHRFRDTFAVSLLEKGVTIENVAMLLGNSPKVAQKHYAPWVKTRQEALDKAVLSALSDEKVA